MGRREVLFPRGSERISQWSEDTLSPAQEGGGEGNQMRTASEYSELSGSCQVGMSTST